VGRFSRAKSLDISQPYGPSRPVIGIALLLPYLLRNKYKFKHTRIYICIFQKVKRSTPENILPFINLRSANIHTLWCHSRKFDAENKRDCHWTRSWASTIHFPSLQPDSLRSILVIKSLEQNPRARSPELYTFQSQLRSPLVLISVSLKVNFNIIPAAYRMQSKRKGIDWFLSYSRNFFKLSRNYDLNIFIARGSGLIEQSDSEKNFEKFQLE
jgi:hypothetical protein